MYFLHFVVENVVMNLCHLCEWERMTIQHVWKVKSMIHCL